MPTPHPLVRMRDDHRAVLAEIDALERTAGGTTGSRGRERRLRELVPLLARQFATHMKAEDELLFPALASALPETRGSIAPLRIEHDDLRHMLAGLARLLDLASSPARDEQIVVQVRDLADLLRIHIRKEESLVFHLAERVLPPSELDRLATRLSSRDSAVAASAVHRVSRRSKPGPSSSASSRGAGWRNHPTQ